MWKSGLNLPFAASRVELAIDLAEEDLCVVLEGDFLHFSAILGELAGVRHLDRFDAHDDGTGMEKLRAA